MHQELTEKHKDMSEVFEQHGWSEVFLNKDTCEFWGFSKGAVMPTAIPQEVVNKALGHGYKSPLRPSLRALRSTLGSVILILLATVSGIAFIPFLVPSSTLYQARTSDGGNPSAQYETYRRPFVMGNTIYLLCNGRIASISGDTPHIVINPERAEKNETVTICK